MAGVAAVGHDPSGNNGQHGQQQRRKRQFVRLPRREGKAYGAARSVGSRSSICLDSTESTIASPTGRSLAW